ncbi:MAG: molybdopterin-synthase adenylyltransferase MoeB [Acidobacteriia bacterium]|nr:molybdopterin-synthase adenylyltransferase MoeB [Terriglobia bacterium]
MPVKILIPTPLRSYAGKKDAIEVSAKTVDEAIKSLIDQHAELKAHLLTENGKLRSFINVYVNDEDIRYLQKESTPLQGNETISIIPSIAGGSAAAKPLAPVSQSIAEAAKQLSLSKEEILRYSRHLIIPEVAMEGQLRLKAARVLTIGAGGLGAPLGMYLAAAGVGTLGVVDFDVVDFTNLQRQVIHSTRDVGRPKLESAMERLKGINPEINIVGFETRLSSQNALEIFKDFDIIVDGTDNFPTRYLVNDACVLLGKPNVYGSIFRFEGQASVFGMPDAPCYRCLYPEPPPPGLVPSCAEGGVLGILPGIIGCIQANETIKLILGQGETLAGRLLLFDALRMKFRELKLRKDPECPVCGTHRTLHQLIDYEQFCGIPQQQAKEKEMSTSSEHEIDAVTLKHQLDQNEKIFILDVREPHEFQICRIPNSHLIPLGDLPSRISELNSADLIVAHCKSGMRSAKACDFLRKSGFTRVKNLKGGILAWSDQVDPSVPKY